MPSRIALLCLALAACDTPDASVRGLPCEGSAPVDADVTFDPDAVLCVAVEMVEADYEELSNQYRFPGGNEDQWPQVIRHTAMSCSEPYPDEYTWFPADVTLDGQEVRDVGIRRKGFLGSVVDGAARPSLKLDLDEYIDDQKLGDTERVTLNNNLQDDSRIRTCLAYSVFADAGHPAPRCNLANVTVNGAHLGTYSHVENPKRDFLRAHFGNDDGSLYEGTLADFTDAHLASLPYGLGRWEAKTDDTDPSGAPLRALADALQVPDDELEAALSEVVDLDAFFRFWAVETLIGHVDGYAQNTNNFYVYFDPDNGDRAVFLPWGPDDAFWSGRTALVTAELPRRLSRHPALSARYRAELQRLLDEVWDEDRLEERIDRWSAQVATAERDLEAHDWSTGHLRDFVRGRRKRVQAFLDEGGTEGGPQTRPCTGDREPSDFLLIGEITTTASLGCATVPRGPSLGLWGIPLLLLRRRSGKTGPDRL